MPDDPLIAVSRADLALVLYHPHPRVDYETRTCLDCGKPAGAHYCAPREEARRRLEALLAEPAAHVPDLARVRAAIRDVLYVCLPGAARDPLVALGVLHTVDAQELLRASVPLPPYVADGVKDAALLSREGK